MEEVVPRVSIQPSVEEEEPPSFVIVEDTRPLPRPFETLRDFFSRTTIDWQKLILEKLQSGDQEHRQPSLKELRKMAFDAADIRYWDCREDIMAEEERQEEAGIGNVVSLADRTKDTAGTGRRR